MKAVYGWEPTYGAAVLETDDAKLPERIEETTRIISARFQELVLEGGSSDERVALSQALHALTVLRAERLQAAADSSKP